MFSLGRLQFWYILGVLLSLVLFVVFISLGILFRGFLVVILVCCVFLDCISVLYGVLCRLLRNDLWSWFLFFCWSCSFFCLSF